MKVSVRYSGLLVGALLAVGVSSVAMGIDFDLSASSNSPQERNSVVLMNNNNGILRNTAASTARRVEGGPAQTLRSNRVPVSTQGGPAWGVRHPGNSQGSPTFGRGGSYNGDPASPWSRRGGGCTSIDGPGSHVSAC